MMCSIIDVDFLPKKKQREREKKREIDKKRAKLTPEISSGLTKSYHYSTIPGRTIELYFLLIRNAQFVDCMCFHK